MVISNPIGIIFTCDLYSNEQQKLIQKNKEEIAKLKFGELKYSDWVEFGQIHDFNIPKKVQKTEEIKSESIRELVALIKYNLDIEDIHISKLEDTVYFLMKIQTYINEYEKELEAIVNSPENYNEKVVIFDGTKENSALDIEGMLGKGHAEKASLLNKIKIFKVRSL